MKFPVMAIASILHRISGLALFLLLPVMLWFLHQSLESVESFTALQTSLTGTGYKLLLLAFCAALVYHVLAGIRHVLMDVGLGEHLVAGRNSARFVIGLAVILTILLGIWIW